MNLIYWTLVLVLFILWVIDAYRSREIAIKEIIVLVLFIIAGAALFGIPG